MLEVRPPRDQLWYVFVNGQRQIVENIRQWCANASTGTQGFPPGPAPGMGIRLLIGVKLFCLTNEVRWQRGVAGEILKFGSMRGKARADRIRMPFRIQSSIVREISFAIAEWRTLFFLPLNSFIFSLIRTKNERYGRRTF